MGQQPVSVVLPVRNGEPYLGRALADLLACLGDLDEIVVVDDGSEDRTPELLRNWSSRDNRIRVVATRAGGLVAALNLGILEAKSEWIARADADDRYPVNRLDVQRPAMSPDVALVTGDYRISVPGGSTSVIPCALGHPFVTASLINPQRIPHPGVAVRREAVLEAGGYKEDDFPAEDLALWIRLSHIGKLVGVAGEVVDWQLRPGSITNSRQAEQRAKTRQLLQAFHAPFSAEDLSDALESEFESYSTAANGERRSLLLLRDLGTWRRRGFGGPTIGTALRSLPCRPIRMASAGLGLGWDASQRRRARRRMQAAVE